MLCRAFSCRRPIRGGPHWQAARFVTRACVQFTQKQASQGGLDGSIDMMISSAQGTTGVQRRSGRENAAWRSSPARTVEFVSMHTSQRLIQLPVPAASDVERHGDRLEARLARQAGVGGSG